MRFPLPLCLLFLLPACAKGGKETTPQSQVQIAASHHLFGLRAQPGFAGFPVRADEVFPDRGTLNLFQESTYTVTRATGTSPADRYALDEKGRLSVYVTGSGRTPTTVMPGAYGLMGDRNDFFFVDGNSTAGSSSLGLFVGTRAVNGSAELAGDWHLVALHALFPASSVLDPNQVARAAYGTITVPAGASVGELRTVVNGAGRDSARNDLNFAGSTLQYFLPGGATTGDGRADVTLRFGPGDDRVVRAAVGLDILLGVDEEESDGEAGLVLMTRALDPAAPADPARLAGTFRVGAVTFFVNPAKSGTDGAVGTLTLTADRAFRFDMIGSRNIDFTYSGTWTLQGNGRIDFQVSGTNETWHGAITRDHHALVLVDDFVETRSNNTPELNLFVALRQKP